MRGSALWFADRIAELPDDSSFDLIFVSDMTSVADLKALLPESLRAVPMVCYFHENQLTYPLSPDDRRDYQFGLTNITSCLAADQVWFNSEFHRESFLGAVGGLLGQMPDCVPPDMAGRIGARSVVVHPGINLELAPEPAPPRRTDSTPGILWNHRWEYDKNPDAFFGALFTLAERSVPFKLMVVGERFRSWPPAFDRARARLSDQIIQFGYLDSRREYIDCLGAADLVVSTANHEFFGLAVLEAVAAGCWPILPKRLSYPELIPAEMHRDVFYAGDDELAAFLADRIAQPAGPDSLEGLVRYARQFCWSVRAGEFDEVASRVAFGG